MTNLQPKQMLYVEPNPENHLNELFKVVEEDSGHCINPNHVPMRERNLPMSFFNQKSASSSASHSRDSSLDASSPLSSSHKATSKHGGAAMAPTNSPSSPMGGLHSPTHSQSHLNPLLPPPPPPQPGLSIVHQKAQSLPASFPQCQPYTFWTGPSADCSGRRGRIGQAGERGCRLPEVGQKWPNSPHHRQQNYEVANKTSMPDNASGEADCNSSSSFADYKQRMAGWQDPRKLIHLTALAQAHSNPAMSQQPQLACAPLVPYSSHPNMPYVIDTQQPMHIHSPHQPNLLPGAADMLPTGLLGQTQHSSSSSSNHHHHHHHDNNQPTTGNISIELVAAMQNMNTCANADSQPPPIQNLSDLQMEIKRIRQKQEEISKNQVFKPDYVPLQQPQVHPLADRFTWMVAGGTASRNQTSPHQDPAHGSHSSLISCTVNNDQANYLNDHSLNRLNNNNMATNHGNEFINLDPSLPYSPGDLDEIDFDEFERMINDNSLSLGPTADESMAYTYQV